MADDDPDWPKISLKDLKRLYNEPRSLEAFVPVSLLLKKLDNEASAAFLRRFAEALYDDEFGETRMEADLGGLRVPFSSSAYQERHKVFTPDEARETFAKNVLVPLGALHRWSKQANQPLPAWLDECVARYRAKQTESDAIPTGSDATKRLSIEEAAILLVSRADEELLTGLTARSVRDWFKNQGLFVDRGQFQESLKLAREKTGLAVRPGRR